jgi:hypothetical protein
MAFWMAAIPAIASLASSAMSSKGSGQQQQAQPSQPQMPMMPFPMNMPDGGKKAPSMLDFDNITGSSPNGLPGMPGMPGGSQNGMQQPGQGQQGQGGNNFMVPGGGKPLSVIDALLPGGSSPSIFNPIQDPIQMGLGSLLKGIFK